MIGRKVESRIAISYMNLHRVRCYIHGKDIVCVLIWPRHGISGL